MSAQNIFENTRLQVAALAMAVVWLASWPVQAYRDYMKDGNTAKYEDFGGFKPVPSLGNEWKLASDRGLCGKPATLKYAFGQQIVAAEPASTEVIGYNANYRIGSNLVIMEFDVLRDGEHDTRSKYLFKIAGREMKLLGNLSDGPEKYVPADADVVRRFTFTKCGKAT